MAIFGHHAATLGLGGTLRLSQSKRLSESNRFVWPFETRRFKPGHALTFHRRHMSLREGLLFDPGNLIGRAAATFLLCFVFGIGCQPDLGDGS
jgi:hypothetical protein